LQEKQLDIDYYILKGIKNNPKKELSDIKPYIQDFKTQSFCLLFQISLKALPEKIINNTKNNP